MNTREEIFEKEKLAIDMTRDFLSRLKIRNPPVQDFLNTIDAWVKELLGDAAINIEFLPEDGFQYPFTNEGTRGETIFAVCDSWGDGKYAQEYVENLVLMIVLYDHMRTNKNFTYDPEEVYKCMVQKHYPDRPRKIYGTTFILYYFPTSEDVVYHFCKKENVEIEPFMSTWGEEAKGLIEITIKDVKEKVVIKNGKDI